MTAEEVAYREEVQTHSPALSPYIPKQHRMALSSHLEEGVGGGAALLRPGTMPALLKLPLVFSLRKAP